MALAAIFKPYPQRLQIRFAADSLFQSFRNWAYIIPSAFPFSIPTDKMLIFTPSHSSDSFTSDTT